MYSKIFSYVPLPKEKLPRQASSMLGSTSSARVFGIAIEDVKFIRIRKKAKKKDTLRILKAIQRNICHCAIYSFQM